MRFEKKFPVYAGELRFTVDAFNLFNSAYAMAVDESFEHANFGKPIAYNDPRQIRLGVRYTF
jgi:hypothetical protein